MPIYKRNIVYYTDSANAKKIANYIQAELKLTCTFTTHNYIEEDSFKKKASWKVIYFSINDSDSDLLTFISTHAKIVEAFTERRVWPPKSEQEIRDECDPLNFLFDCSEEFENIQDLRELQVQQKYETSDI